MAKSIGAFVDMLDSSMITYVDDGDEVGDDDFDQNDDGDDDSNQNSDCDDDDESLAGGGLMMEGRKRWRIRYGGFLDEKK